MPAVVTHPALKPLDFHHPDIAAQAYAQLADVGFLVLKNHPVPYGLVSEVSRYWHSFFARGHKAAFLFNEEKHDGFVPIERSESAKGHGVKDLKMFYHFYPWGRCPVYLKTITERLYWQLSQVSQVVLRWIDHACPQEVRDQCVMPLADMTQACPRTLLRPVYYPSLLGDESPDAMRAAPYQDLNMLTLTPAASIDRLQVQDRGGVWHDVPHHTQCLLVSVGDMMQEALGRHLVSATKRVLNPVGVAAKRASLGLPLYLHAHDDIPLSTRFTAKAFREQRWRDIGLVSETPTAVRDMLAFID